MTNLLSEGRYDRQELITWWDQRALRVSRVLVVGAGALGNEVVKNLTLLGVGHIVVVDMDTVSTSNLSRCVFFQNGDEGAPKAVLVARRARDLNPEVDAEAVVAPVQAGGVGWVSTFDLVIGCLDNREARVWINQACRKFGKTWIDGAIEGIRGVVKVFPASGACYECTLGEVDRAILEKRKACSLLSAEEIDLGKVPTTASTSSVIAGLQCQEAVRILNGLTSPLNNKGWFMIGESFDTYIVNYEEDEGCAAHEDYRNHSVVHPLIGETIRAIVTPFAGDVAMFEVQFEDVIVREGRCFDCGVVKVIHKIIGEVSRDEVTCPSCSAQLGLNITSTLSSDDPLLNQTPIDLGLAPFDVLSIRTKDRISRLAFVPEEM